MVHPVPHGISVPTTRTAPLSLPRAATAPRGQRDGYRRARFGDLRRGVCLYPLIGLIAWPLLIIGRSLGRLGRQKATSGTATNGTSARAGVILCDIALLICLGWVALFATGMPST
ncbi:hypothetical protein [Halosaccharopolyspora lacisalsi]|uniref:hypothetical protein n=1 Tax=Halosaccharopolyspora lacisalsi TaxID=1000566 RepID=UPI0015F8E562|nr:hypothetical protein [Halosaccharopolyspora lacisalsi]